MYVLYLYSSSLSSTSTSILILIDPSSNLNKQQHDEEEIEPQERYSSSDVIAAAEELKFKQAAWMGLQFIIFMFGIWLLIPWIYAPEFVRIGPELFGVHGGIPADIACNDVVGIVWDSIRNKGLKISYFFGDLLYKLCIYNCLAMVGSMVGNGCDDAVEDAYEYSLDDGLFERYITYYILTNEFKYF